MQTKEIFALLTKKEIRVSVAQLEMQTIETTVLLLLRIIVVFVVL
jgi:hypothetical protein